MLPFYNLTEGHFQKHGPISIKNDFFEKKGPTDLEKALHKSSLPVNTVSELRLRQKMECKLWLLGPGRLASLCSRSPCFHPRFLGYPTFQCGYQDILSGGCHYLDNGSSDQWFRTRIGIIVMIRICRWSTIGFWIKSRRCWLRTTVLWIMFRCFWMRTTGLRITSRRCWMRTTGSWISISTSDVVAVTLKKGTNLLVGDRPGDF